MKKVLFSCFLAMGVCASAQYDFLGDFESTASNYGQFGGGTITAAAACNGAAGGQLALSASTTQTGWMVQLDATGQISNGQAATVTASYKKPAGLVGTISLAYFIQDDSGSWDVVPFGNAVSLPSTAITTCATLSGVIPAGALQTNNVNAVGVWVTRASGSGNVFTDDIKILQDIATTAPACTTFTSPTAGSTIDGGSSTFKWTAVPTASNYKVTVGTTAGGSDVFNQLIDGNVTSTYIALGTNKTYFAKIVPTNEVGDATGCTEIQFSTNATIGVCGPLTSNQAAAVFPISSVAFGGVTNTSSATAGPVTPYEDFRNIVMPILAGTTTLPITVIGSANGVASNGWAMSVFIDWNNDGDFVDAGESYFNTQETMIRIANSTNTNITLTGNIAVPSGVVAGPKTMRVKYNYSGTALHPALSTACYEMGNGQAEDYIVNYGALAVSDINKAKATVYPNPFKDVLRISDVKDANGIVITDISGRTVKTLAPAAELNLSDLKKGVYIVTIKYVDGSNQTTKVIKD